MRPLRAVVLRLAGVFSKGRRERAFADELESHLRMHIEDNLRAGMTREEARRQALIKLGGIEQAKERYRDRLGIPGIESIIQDLRFGLRQLRRNPGFTAVAVITLALGIGANTAIFSLIDAVMVRSMPVRKPSQLVLFRWKARRAPRIDGMSMFGDCPGNSGGPNPTTCSFTLPVFEKFRSETNLFSGVTAFAGPVPLDVSGHGPPTIARGELVSGDCFSTLGVRAALGRVTEESDDTAASSPAAVLSYAYWQTAFGGQQSVIGRTITLNNVPFTIIGVADPAFTRLTPGMKQDFWLPLALAPRLGVPWAQDMKSATNWWLVVVGRLRSGVPLAKAQAAASLLFRNEMLHGAKPLSKPQDNPAVTLVPAQEGLTGLRLFFSTPLYVLMAAVGIILLIACANVART